MARKNQPEWGCWVYGPDFLGKTHGPGKCQADLLGMQFGALRIGPVPLLLFFTLTSEKEGSQQLSSNAAYFAVGVLMRGRHDYPHFSEVDVEA